MATNLVVLGCQWGDEGKGKVVDRLSADVDLVVRFQGGANAGHTVKVGDDMFILHLVPTGILREDVECLLGPGMVIDPWTLCEELDTLEEKGVAASSRLYLSGSAHLVMPYHKRLDECRESELASKSIGTTKRGIGPAYEDKMARLGIRVADLTRQESSLRRLVIEKVLRANRLLAERHEAPPLAAEALADEVLEVAARLKDRVVLAYEFLAPVREGTKSALLEGAQGTLLDIDHGTFPFVTSSSCTIGGALTGTGLSHRALHRVLGVYKAYCTRVGNGPFPAELHGEEAEALRAQGQEFGATTGRPRRCGWFDVPAARYAAELNGLDGIILTKLDVLSGMPELRIVTGYELDGERLDRFTNWTDRLDRCQPILETLEGWTEDISQATSFEQLPVNAQRYVARLEELVGVPIRAVCHGPTRDSWLDRAAGTGPGAAAGRSAAG